MRLTGERYAVSLEKLGFYVVDTYTDDRVSEVFHSRFKAAREADRMNEGHEDRMREVHP